MNQDRWTPLLGGADADQAWAALRAVGDALAASVPATTPEARFRNPSLGAGSAGIALFLRYLAEAMPGEGYAEVADRYLDAATEDLSAWPMLAGLYGGFSGVAWTLRHLERDPQDGAGTEEIDELLLSALGRPRWLPEYDLIGGLVGLGVYGLEALPDPFGRRSLERVVAHLDERHEETRQGVTWFTPREQVPRIQQHLAPNGYYNLGVAHGVPGVLVALAGCAHAGVAGERSRRLLDGAVAWLVAQRQDPGVGASFASWVGEGIEPARSRLAWCYGDPGLGAALLAAGRAVGEANWQEAGTDVLRFAARRSRDTAGVIDVGLCHGSAGLAHIFNRAYQTTGDEELKVAALHWCRKTLEMRRPGEGVAGFLSYEPAGDDRLELRGEPGFLTGASGVVLALLAAVTPIEPAWDRVLALSVPQAVAAEERVGTRRAAGVCAAGALLEAPAP